MDTARIEDSFRASRDGRCSVAREGMVATSFPDATAAGVRMLELGGNAVDAACAVGFALGVCDPQMSGLGGQTLGIVHMRNRTFALDGSSRVPSLAHLKQFKTGERSVGYRAATVPSTPATLAWLHRRYGRLRWSEVLQPAIRIAWDGCVITERTNALQERELENFLKVPSRSGARYFLKDGSRPYDAGDIFQQPDLARFLELLAREGVEDFYLGGVAARIDADMRRNGGFLRADDLALIPWPIIRRPLWRSYRGVRIATMPPPGAGRTLLLVMLVLENLSGDFLSGSSSRRLHFLAEAFRKALLLRTQRPFNPNTYPQIPNKVMLSRRHAKRIAKSIAEVIDPHLPMDVMASAADELDETTHFSVMDAEEGVVSITQSVELAYGSKAAADGLGFLYNNYMLTLDVANPEHPYYLRPNAVPWSSAAPTILFLGRNPWIAAGSPGSELIYSSLAQFLIHVIDGNRSIATAVDRPRMHCSIGGTVSIESERFSEAVLAYLERVGYQLERRTAYALGSIQATLRCRNGKGFQGVADPRRDGTAKGPAEVRFPE